MTHPDFDLSMEALGLSNAVPTLRAAAATTTEITCQLRNYLAEILGTPGELPLDVVVFGSLARDEASEHSDLDYLVMLHGVCGDPHLTQRALEAVDRFASDNGLQPPGRSGMFGRVVGAPEIIERIGLEADTNLSHSRRTLLVTESRSVYDETQHAQLVAGILRRYLADYEEPKAGPPRFLLNDVTRYWRTIAVDYQAKLWEEPSAPKWAMRYLKLLFSRKLSYAGALVPLLTCQEAAVEPLQDAFTRPPLVRLARLALREDFDRRPSLASVIQHAEWFAERLRDKAFRDAVNKVDSRAELLADPVLDDARARAHALQVDLEAVFLDSELLGARSRKYLSF